MLCDSWPSHLYMSNMTLLKVENLTIFFLWEQITNMYNSREFLPHMVVHNNIFGSDWYNTILQFFFNVQMVRTAPFGALSQNLFGPPISKIFKSFIMIKSCIMIKFQYLNHKTYMVIFWYFFPKFLENYQFIWRKFSCFQIIIKLLYF